MSVTLRRERAIDFVRSIPPTRLDDAIVSPAFTAWTAVARSVSRETYLQRATAFAGMFPAGLTITIDRTVAEDHAVTIQARGNGRLRDGSTYDQVYMFVVEFDADDRIVHLREYMDTRLVDHIARLMAAA